MTSSPSTAAKKPAEAKLMEFSVTQETLLTEVTAVRRVAETKTTNPILTHLLLEATDGIGT